MSELRQRKLNKSDEIVESSPRDKAEVYLKAIVDKSPNNIKPYLEKATPVIVTIIDLSVKSIPYIYSAISKIKAVLKELEPYKLDLLLPSLVGFILCFFGGSFLTLIAAVEAYRLVGYESSIKCLYDIYDGRI